MSSMNYTCKAQQSTMTQPTTTASPPRFEAYQARAITFYDVVRVEDWHVKVYTITNRTAFGADAVLTKALARLSTWLGWAQHTGLPVYQHAFLIVHEAREGVWILLNWWTGGEMIQTAVYFADSATPDVIAPSPHAGALVCVWELEVIWHERRAWISHVLQHAEAPHFGRYLNDVLQP